MFQANLNFLYSRQSFTTSPSYLPLLKLRLKNSFHAAALFWMFIHVVDLVKTVFQGYCRDTEVQPAAAVLAEKSLDSDQIRFTLG